MIHEFDSLIGGIDFGWIRQAADYTAELDDCSVRLSPEGDGLELLELMPPHRPMWVRRENKVYAEVLWVARIALWTRHWKDNKASHKREVLVLVAGDYVDDMFGLHAYSMHQLALAVPPDGTVETFDASNWDADALYRDKSLHGYGFTHELPKEGGQE